MQSRVHILVAVIERLG
uniref:Uncharacterized protein n=1 Tax=Anguilla anguilla TaxID=7936 RepID=A0A0E9R4U1_ANGAN